MSLATLVVPLVALVAGWVRGARYGRDQERARIAALLARPVDREWMEHFSE